MGHAHGPDTQRSAGARHRRPLAIAFTITLVYMAAEVAGGVAFGSLALLSDAAHMGTDVLGLGMALAAITLANRPGPRRRTYGTYRLEVLAALANGVLLFGVAGYVLVEAALRWAAPPDVPGLPLLVVAGGGLVVNLVSFRLLSSGAKDSLNLKAAHLEVVGDLLGSFAVLKPARGHPRDRLALRGPGAGRRDRAVHPAARGARDGAGGTDPAGGRAT